MERSATLRREEVLIPAGAVTLAGELSVPAGADGMVVFAHGSGSSRFSPRNLFVAEVLQNHGLATLLIDLLTPREEQIDERTTEYRFDIELLTGRGGRGLAAAAARRARAAHRPVRG
jgi:putative phosphoribosyl transferase